MAQQYKPATGLAALEAAFTPGTEADANRKAAPEKNAEPIANDKEGQK